MWVSGLWRGMDVVWLMPDSVARLLDRGQVFVLASDLRHSLAFCALHLVQVITHGRLTSSARSRLQRQQRGFSSVLPPRPYGSATGPPDASCVVTGIRRISDTKSAQL